MTLPRLQEHLGLLAGAHPGRGTRGDDVSRHQGHVPAHVAHDRLHVEDHGAGVAVLVAVSIHLQPHVEDAGVGNLVLRRDPGADGRERVGALALDPLAGASELELPLGDVVDQAVAGNVVEGVVFLDVARARADDDSQLDLPVALHRTPGQHHVVVRPADRGGRLHEQDRLVRNGLAGLLGMIGVVEPDAEQLADTAHRAAEPRFRLDRGQRCGIDRRDSRQALRREHRAVDVDDVPRQIAHSTAGIQDAGLLGARLAVPDQLHERPSSECA